MISEKVLGRYLTSQHHFEVGGAVMVSSPTIEAIQKEGEAALQTLLGDEAASYIQARVCRDGNKAHVTVVSPPELRGWLDEYTMKALAADPTLSKGKAKEAAKTSLKEQVGSWVVGNLYSRGLGKAKADGNEAYFMVLDWPEGRKLRESLGLDGDGQDFHVTVGFKGADVHGVRKNRPLAG